MGEVVMLEFKCDYEKLRHMKLKLYHYMHAYSEYIEFFEGVAEINYGREARAIYDGGMHRSTMRNARYRYERNPELNVRACDIERRYEFLPCKLP